MLELALIFPVELHAYSHKRTLGLSDTGLPIGVHQTLVVTRDAFLKMHQAAVIIRKTGRRTELKYPIPHDIIIQMNGTSNLAQRSPS